jgi:hypothetical protein
MSSVPALPDPDAVSLARIPAVIATAVAWREWCREEGDASDAEELRRRLAAFERYVKDRESRIALAAESRRTEILIGELLGPAEWGGDRSQTSKSQHSDLLVKQRASEFRLMAAWADVIENLLKDGVTSRPKILDHITRRIAAEKTPAPVVREGDFRSALEDIADNSVSLVLTDPPYGYEAVPLYDALGEFAARVLQPGGSLVAYAGQGALPEVIAALHPHLRYWWTLAVDHQHGGQQLPGKWVICEWKPLLWYVKDHRAGRDYVADRLRGTQPDKAAHEWAQGSDEVRILVERLTVPGELVVDPFAGSGAVGQVVEDMGRRWVGADLNPESRIGSVA